MNKLKIGDKFKAGDSTYIFAGYLFQPLQQYNAYAVADENGEVQDYLSGLSNGKNHNPRSNWSSQNHKLERVKEKSSIFAVKVGDEWATTPWMTLADFFKLHGVHTPFIVLETRE